MAKKNQPFDAWLSKEYPKHKCIGMAYDVDAKRYKVLVAKRVEVPKHVRVEVEDEDKYNAEPRKHLLLPGVE